MALTAAIVLAASAPCWLAYTVPPDHVFTGALFNPRDAQSYLAKMREGWRGDWLFTLPYTADPGPGTFIFTYYLGLGHLARLLNLKLDWVYHLARVLAGAFLLLSAYHFISRFFETARARLAVWLLFAVGSGLGWLAVPFGVVPGDLWMAEAIPFLSAFSNSHFCLAAGLVLWIFEWTLTPDADEHAPARTKAGANETDGEGAGVPKSAVRSPVSRESILRLSLTALAVTALAQVLPMTLLVVGVVVGAVTLLEGIRQARQQEWPLACLLLWRGWLPLLVVGAFAAPWLLYDATITFTVPQIAGWNAQNITPTPPVWEALLSGGVPLALAGVGAAVVCVPRGGAALRRQQPQMVMPVVWLGLNIVLLYAPLATQRQLSLGIWTPMVILAGLAWRQVIWPRLARPARLLAVAGVALLVLPSNLLVYAAAFSAVPRRAPEVFLTQDEAAALDWLAGQPAGRVVLASPDFSLFIPARTDARVIYGHPHETVNAAAKQQAVEDFFAGRISPEMFEEQDQVDYVVYGPREKELGPEPALNGWGKVFQQGEVTIYGR